MLEEMPHCLVEDEHAAKQDGSGQKKNNAQPSIYNQQWFSNEKNHSEGNHEQKDQRIAENFIRGILTREEAAKLQDGKLPPGATHEIVETKEGELPKIRRRRFSL